jgi:hypothetical protein
MKLQRLRNANNSSYGNRQSQLMAHGAVRTVGGDHPVRPDVFASPVGVAQHRVHAVRVLREADQLHSPFAAAAEFLHSVQRDLLCRVLRQHQQIRVRGVQTAEVEFGDLALLAENVEPAHRQSPRRRLHYTEPLEQLQRPGLQPERLRADVVVGRGVDASHVDASTTQLRRRGQPDRTGTHNKYLDVAASHGATRSGKAGSTHRAKSRIWSSISSTVFATNSVA